MKIGVIGLGLIGGSIFKALRDKHNVIGVSRSVNEDGVTNDYSALRDCDLVFVCTPMNAILEILDKLETILPETTIVTDVCSLKEFVSKNKYSYKFIPSHPMAGTEHNGWEYSFPEMFRGANWVITPINGEIIDGQEILEKIINELGAKTIITSPKEHDEAVALISHLPLVIAQALCENIRDNKLAQAMASSGFRDTTRLALSNTEMANDMVHMNNENIELAFAGVLNSLSSLLNGDNYKQKADLIKQFRANLYS